jgi:hypothetical protein
MVNPVPYNFDSSDNSPLEAAGSNFPCKITGDYTVTKENYMVKGETQSMTFHGGTTHGGGSCQISLTSDRAPSNSTTWSVIMSIEGGCMDETESNSNIGTSATMVTPFSPNFTIPDSIDAGEYTIAWTWFNRIGSREMYMNCAPITITESSSSKKRSESAAVEKRSSEFPPLFIANINGCLTEEMYDIRFPNPGNTIEYLGPSGHLIASDTNVCYSGSVTWGTAGHSTTTASGSSQSSSTTTTATTATTAKVTAEASVRTSLTLAVPSQNVEAGKATEITPTTTTSFVSVNTSSADESSISGSASSSSSGALTGSCSQQGYWNCISGTSFQRCAGGTWTPAQPMPDGTECIAGQSKDLAINAVSVTFQTLDEKHLRTHKTGTSRHR